jgi:hypothetical protein
MKQTSKQLLDAYNASKKHYKRSKKNNDPQMLRKLAAEVMREDKQLFKDSLKSE